MSRRAGRDKWILEFGLGVETCGPVQEDVNFMMNIIEIAMDFSGRDLASCKLLQDVIDHQGGPELSFKAG